MRNSHHWTLAKQFTVRGSKCQDRVIDSDLKNPEDRMTQCQESYFKFQKKNQFSLGVFHCIQWNKSSEFQTVHTNILHMLPTHYVPGIGPDFRVREFQGK